VGFELTDRLADQPGREVRLTRGALRLAARHELAVRSVLGELAGTASGDASAILLERARRHLDRANGLLKVASRTISASIANDALAAALERHAALRRELTERAAQG
jgi:hypothetical protein